MERLGAFEFDSRREELWRDGQLVRLPPQPARMLALLVERRGSIVPHEEARAAIWGEAVVEFDQGLHTIVKQVRAALGDDAKHPRFVQTIPRRGYRLLEDCLQPREPERATRAHHTAAAPESLLPARARPRGRIALSVASFLLLGLSFVVLARPPMTSAHHPAPLAIGPDALGHYLEGLQAMEEGQYELAARLFDSALSIEPREARVLSARAEARLWLGPRDAKLIELARDDAQRALRLDPRLIEPRLTLGRIAMNRDRDPRAARAHLERAVREAPRTIEARLALARCHSAMGEHDLAIEQTQRAMAIDALGVQSLVDSGWVYFYARRFDQALAFADRALGLEALDAAALGLRFESLIQKGEWSRAGDVLETLMALASVPQDDRPDRDRQADPRAFIREAMELHLERHLARDSSPVILAIDWIRLGEPDRAFEALDRILAIELCSFVPFIGVDPRLDPLRADPRFESVERAAKRPAF